MAYDIPTRFHKLWSRHLKRGDLKKNSIFHQTSWNIVGIFTIVCGSFWCVDKIQNGGRCHGNQGLSYLSLCFQNQYKFSTWQKHILQPELPLQSNSERHPTPTNCSHFET
jgi:hypothetical protein